MCTLSAFTIASAASIIATSPRVSIIPKASPVLASRTTLRQHTARAQGFIHQRDQFLARYLQPLSTRFNVLRHHWTSRLHAGARLYPVACARIKQLVHLVLGQHLGTAQ